MLDPITLDQLRMLEAVVETGSFSAAARRLQRVQSAVSTAMANLEAQLGVLLWDRTGRVARLTAAGDAILAHGRRVLGEVDALRKRATELAGGVEASVSLCVDAVFPLAALVDLCRGFARAFPAVDLRVEVQTMAAVAARVLDRTASLGVAMPIAHAPELDRHPLAPIRMLPVAARSHPLARVRGRIPTETLADHVQIVLSERTPTVPDQAVLSARTWRVDDLHTKHALLLAGLGWGNLPEHVARPDIARRRLAILRPAAWADDEHVLHLAVVHRRDVALGPAHRWVVDQLATLCAAIVGGRVRHS